MAALSGCPLRARELRRVSAELEVEPIAQGNEEGTGEQAGQDVHDIVIVAVNGRKREEESKEEVGVTDAPEVAE